MNLRHFFPRVHKSRIVIPLVVAFVINVFMYLVLRPDTISILAPRLGLVFYIIECLLIVLFASAPLCYGWFTKRPRESALFGVFLTTFLCLPGSLEVLHLLGPKQILESIAYCGVSALFGGGAGYMAARGGLRHYIGAVTFVLLWVIILLSGIN